MSARREGASRPHGRTWGISLVFGRGVYFGFWGREMGRVGPKSGDIDLGKGGGLKDQGADLLHAPFLAALMSGERPAYSSV